MRKGLPNQRLESAPYIPEPGQNGRGHKDFLLYEAVPGSDDAVLAVQNPKDDQAWALYSLPGYGSWLSKEADFDKKSSQIGSSSFPTPAEKPKITKVVFHRGVLDQELHPDSFNSEALIAHSFALERLIESPDQAHVADRRPNLNLSSAVDYLSLEWSMEGASSSESRAYSALVLYKDPEQPADAFWAGQNAVTKEWSVYSLSGYGPWLAKELDLLARHYGF